MVRILRVPLPRDKCLRPLEPHFHWNHFSDFRVLVVVIADMWGRRNVAHLYRYLDVAHHRTRLNHFFLIARWDPAAALRQQAHELLLAVQPQPGDTVYRMIDDAKTATRGRPMAAVTTMKDPTTEAYRRGHQYGCAILAYHDHVIPVGIRRYVKKEHGEALGLPFHQTTALAAQLIREFQAPAGVQVMVVCDAYDLCHPVVQAGRDQGCHLASTLKGHRRLGTQGWRLNAGRDGPHRFRRRRTTLVVIEQPHGPSRYRWVDAGGLQVSTLGPWHVVCSRTGAARKILGLVTDEPELPAVRLIPTDETRWAVELFFKDAKQLRGLGHDQHRSSGAAVIHRHLGCFA